MSWESIIVHKAHVSFPPLFVVVAGRWSLTGVQHRPLKMSGAKSAVTKEQMERFKKILEKCMKEDQARGGDSWGGGGGGPHAARRSLG